MKLSDYPEYEYFFYTQTQVKLHIYSWQVENKGFGLCGVDIGYDGDDDFPDDLYDVIGSEFPNEKICKKCLRSYARLKMEEGALKK